jgi:hypothetical protein
LKIKIERKGDNWFRAKFDSMLDFVERFKTVLSELVNHDTSWVQCAWFRVCSNENKTKTTWFTLKNRRNLAPPSEKRSLQTSNAFTDTESLKLET